MRKKFQPDAALTHHKKDKLPSSGPTPSRPEGKASKKRRSLRKRNRHPVAIGVIAISIALVVGLYFVVSPSLVTPDNYPFPCSGSESVVYHAHPYLRIVVNSQNVTIPAYVGIASGGAGTCFEPLHTHDASGIIHIESSSNRNYTLGDFFAIWRDTYANVAIAGVSHPVVFNSTDVLGFKSDSTHRIVVLVDGRPYPGDPTLLVLDTLDYCSAATTGPTCYPTAVGNPSWNGQVGNYPYGTGHTIVVEYLSATG